MRWGFKLILVTGVLLVFAELFVRAGIGLGLVGFRDPALYFDWSNDDNYWKYRHVWIAPLITKRPEMVDPILGWMTPSTPVAALPNKRKILFFGDNFIQGVGGEKPNQNLGDLLTQDLPEAQVVVYGETGYGLDQIYLKFQRVLATSASSVVLLGITTVDLDRSVLHFRTGPKPYYVVQNGQLMLRGIPIGDVASFLEREPPRVASFLWAMVSHQIKKRLSGRELEIPSGQNEKRLINGRILDEMVSEASARKISVVPVLFFSREEMAYEGWRETFLTDYFRRKGLPFFSCKEWLRREARLRKRPVGSFYLPEGHFSPEGNELVARDLATKLKEELGRLKDAK